MIGLKAGRIRWFALGITLIGIILGAEMFWTRDARELMLFGGILAFTGGSLALLNQRTRARGFRSNIWSGIGAAAGAALIWISGSSLLIH